MGTWRKSFSLLVSEGEALLLGHTIQSVWRTTPASLHMQPVGHVLCVCVCTPVSVGRQPALPATGLCAGVSRQREVYVMAANYLQSLNWRAQPDYLNHILTFYTKAGAGDSLAQFYLSCAHTELTQFRAYDKALQARPHTALTTALLGNRLQAADELSPAGAHSLRPVQLPLCHHSLQAMEEAAKHLAKSRTTDREAQVAALQEASDRISRFVQAHSLIDQDPAAAVALCQQLLQEAPEQLVSAASCTSWCCLQVGERHSTSARRPRNWSIRPPCTRTQLRSTVPVH